MKTQLLTLATILIFALSVSANDNNLSRPDNVSTNNLFYSVEADEIPLSIDSWMTNDEMWCNESEKLVGLETSTEEELTIESWMTNNKLWNKTSNTVPLYTELTMGNQTYILVSTRKVNEAPLKIESWMTDDSAWSL